jgi:hypothetical protein
MSSLSSLPDVDPFFDNETDIWDELPTDPDYPYD